MIATDSYTYERFAIENLMQQTPPPAMPPSPTTGEPFSSRRLVPNRLASDFIGHMHLSVKG